MGDYDPYTLSLLEESTSGPTLQFVSRKTGMPFEASPEHTLLASGGVGRDLSSSKYRNALKVTAHDPTNPRERLKNGCENCGRKVVSYQRLGEMKTMYYVCLCGNSWHN
jgi:DNA-directed RNA polymerase subunit M/transcription elongation factor TFIIS